MKRAGSDDTLRCSFCHKSQDVVGKLVDQRVWGVHAFAGHRDDDDRYTEQPQQGRDLH